MTNRRPSSTGWMKMRFGDIAQHIAERVEPTSADSALYVGLDHLDSGSLTVRRWGSETGLIGTKLRMRKGDILFARRNAYLRRVAIAPHDGLFSAHGMVLRPRSDEVVQDFLPFFMQSNQFMDRAERISVGSLSPTINWTTLKDEVFDIPPIATQARIVDALSPLDRCLDCYGKLTDRLTEVRRSLEARLIGGPLGLKHGSLDLRSATPCAGWEVLTGQQLLDRGFLTALQDGNHGSQYPRANELGEVGLPYISASDISDNGEINLDACRRLQPERAAALRIPPARSGDVILTNNATVGRVTQLPEWPTDIVASTSTTYYRCNEEALAPEYLRWYLESECFQWQLRSIMRQSTRNQVPITTQKRLLFAVPNRPRQEELASLRRRFLHAHTAAAARSGRTQAFRRELLEAALV